MDAAELLTRMAAELALFAGVGFLLFGLNDLVVDLIYFTRRFWRSATVYKRHRRTYASYYVFNKNWRQRLAGTAQPGSGPALTLGANF